MAKSDEEPIAMLVSRRPRWWLLPDWRLRRSRRTMLDEPQVPQLPTVVEWFGHDPAMCPPRQQAVGTGGDLLHCPLCQPE